MIPCSNPLAQYKAHKKEIDAAVIRVMESGWYINGTEVKLFEEEFARFIGVKHGIGVANGTEALLVALKACGIGAGDEVITVSHTAVATVAAIEMAGAVPVIIDIERDYFTMNPELLEKAITRKTRAVIPVHIYGQPANLHPILETAKKHGLKVIEDCAQAHGAMYDGKRVGSWGDIACFSYYPTKNLGAIGDGGMVVTNDAGLAEQARLVREYGWAERYVSHIPGYNSRLDELQAALLRVKLKYLDQDNQARVALAVLYEKGLKNSPFTLPVRRVGGGHIYHVYVIRTPERDSLQAYLKDRGIGALIHYPVPIHLQPAYRGRIRLSGNLAETESAALEVLSIPMYPELSTENVQEVIQVLKLF